MGLGALTAALVWMSVALGSNLPAEAVSSCTCGTLESQIDQADAVFIGRVRDVSVEADGPAGREVLWNIEVEQSFIGPEAEVIAVSGGGELSNCSIDLEPGEEYGIVAFWRSGHLATSQCGVTTPETLEALMSSPGAGTNWPALVVASALSLSGLLVVVIVRYRRREKSANS